MNFRSDNEVGAHPSIDRGRGPRLLAAAAPSPTAPTTGRSGSSIACASCSKSPTWWPSRSPPAPPPTCLALACCSPPWGAIFCHPHGPHRRRGGQRAGVLSPAGAKLVPHRRRGRQDRSPRSSPRRWPSRSTACVHHPQPAAVSITQATECGTVYAPEEIAAIATSTHRHGLKLHMDGARFANALSFVGCSPAELSWKAGVDVLSLGATKNGAMARRGRGVLRRRAGARLRVPPQARRPSACPRCACCRPSSTPTCRRPVARQRPPRQRHGAPAGGRADAAQGHAAHVPGRRQRDLRRHAGAHARCAAGRRRASIIPGRRTGRASAPSASSPPSIPTRPTSITSSPSPRQREYPMTHQRTLTAAHWGVYEVEYDDNGKATRLHPFSKDPDPSPIGLHMLSDEVTRLRVRRPAVRKSWLEKGPGAAPEKRGQEPFVEVEWDEALDLVAAELEAGQGHARQPRDLRRLLRLVERRPLPSRAEPGPSLPELGRRLRAPPGFLQPGRRPRADAAHRGADGRADVHAHAVGRAWPSIASSSSPSAACRTRTRRSTPAAPAKHHVKGGLYGMRDKGVRFVNVTPTADDLDTGGAVEWLAIRPNTDAALILALCHTLLAENLHDRDFLDRCTRRLRARSGVPLGSPARTPRGPRRSPASPPRASSPSRARWRRRARWSASAGRCSAPSRRAAVLGAGHARLHAGPDRPAGRRLRRGLRPGQRRWAARVRRTPARRCRRAPTRSSDFIPVARFTDMLLQSRRHVRLQRPRPAPIPTSAWSTGRAAIRSTTTRTSTGSCAAWRKPETIVFHEQFWTPAARMADIVLPATTSLERDDIGYGRREPYMIAMKKARDPVGEARDDYAIFAGARRAPGRGRGVHRGPRHAWRGCGISTSCRARSRPKPASTCRRSTTFWAGRHAEAKGETRERR